MDSIHKDTTVGVCIWDGAKFFGIPLLAISKTAVIFPFIYCW